MCTERTSFWHYAMSSALNWDSQVGFATVVVKFMAKGKVLSNVFSIELGLPVGFTTVMVKVKVKVKVLINVHSIELVLSGWFRYGHV